jgi:ribonuclease Y
MITIKEVFVLALTTGIVGVIVGYLVRVLLAFGKKGSIEMETKRMMLEAREEAKKVTLEAEEKAADLLKTTREELKEREEKLKKTEDRLLKKEESLDKKQLEAEKEAEVLKKKADTVREIKERVDEMERGKKLEVEKIGKLTEDEAKKLILKQAEINAEEDIVVRMRKFEAFGEGKIEERAKEILSTTIQRLASSVSADMFTSHIVIPSDEVKGKVIGKEGRNIKSFERESGVEVVIDDTPGAITLSSFDPVRRQIAKMAMEALIADGRIQPAKIEKEIETAKQNINKIIKEKGEQAAFQCGVINIDPRILSILGRLHFRTSYGQNVLQHSIEVSNICGMLAEELGANVAIARAGGLFHDIGKAVDHEVQGTHVEIGRRILQKFGASEEIVKAMQSHHEEYPYETIESVIVQTADAISGARPGARNDSIENYIKRLQDLEAVANEFEGVEKSYAIAAGREIRIFVFPDKVSDLESMKMARDIAVKIESELKYPGEIKVNVIREMKAIEFAR